MWRYRTDGYTYIHVRTGDIPQLALKKRHGSSARKQQLSVLSWAWAPLGSSGLLGNVFVDSEETHSGAGSATFCTLRAEYRQSTSTIQTCSLHHSSGMGKVVTTLGGRAGEDAGSWHFSRTHLVRKYADRWRTGARRHVYLDRYTLASRGLSIVIFSPITGYDRTASLQPSYLSSLFVFYAFCSAS